ncbi:MAG: hypothetical protein ACPHYE_08620 [Henriciella sp.]|nr:MAG: Uncharacterised protein [Hyphomonas sp. TMED17]
MAVYYCCARGQIFSSFDRVRRSHGIGQVKQARHIPEALGCDFARSGSELATSLRNVLFVHNG